MKSKNAVAKVRNPKRDLLMEAWLDMAKKESQLYN